MPVQTGKRDDIVHLHQDNPCWSLAKIGRNVGVSRERVRQIVGKFPRQKKDKRKCIFCGSPISRVNAAGVCQRCRKVVVECQLCGRKVEKIHSQSHQVQPLLL